MIYLSPAATGLLTLSIAALVPSCRLGWIGTTIRDLVAGSRQGLLPGLLVDPAHQRGPSGFGHMAGNLAV